MLYNAIKIFIEEGRGNIILNFKKTMPRVLLLVVLILLCCIGVFKYITSVKSNNSKNITVCSDCETWEKAHQELTFCAQVISQCPLCGKERPCA